MTDRGREPTAREPLRELVDKDRIGGVITALFVGTDSRDWESVRRCFASSVHFDMTSLAGGDPVVLPPDAIVAGWEAGLAPIEAIHHQTGNLSVRCTEREADASCYGIAYHHRRTRSGKNTRAFVGSYDFHLRREAGEWKIDLFRFRLKFIDGNPDLDKEPTAPTA
jgi:hypothetical protein